MTQNTKRNLKLKAFKRDGWREKGEFKQEASGWRAHCSFGCGEILTWNTASLDRYPIMGKDGGTYTLDNIRLACRPCNSACRNHKENPSKRVKKRAIRKEQRMAARLAAGKPTKSDREIMYERANHNVPRVIEYPSPGYSLEVKRKLRENYPKSETINRNGIRLNTPVIYDVAKGKFRYDT